MKIIFMMIFLLIIHLIKIRTKFIIIFCHSLHNHYHYHYQATSGKVQVSLSWLPTTRDAAVVKKRAKRATPGDDTAKCLIHVYVDSCSNLVVGKSLGYKPTPVVQV